MIISFAWTTPALLAGAKTVTRRDYDDRYMAKFKPGDIVDAWDKSSRAGGKRVARLRLISVRREQLPDPYNNRIHAKREWLLEGGKHLASDPETFFDGWPEAKKHPSGDWVRIEFVLLEKL